jgi:queuine tRNA-ribosyltransferase
LNLRNARHAEDSGPIDPDCGCPACRQFSRAYLHHTVKSNEIIASMLLTWHNLTYYQDLMASLRKAVSEGRLASLVAEVAEAYARGEKTESE